jgi:hypothetical protein
MWPACRSLGVCRRPLPRRCFACLGFPIKVVTALVRWNELCPRTDTEGRLPSSYTTSGIDAECPIQGTCCLKKGLGPTGGGPSFKSCGQDC